MVRGSVERRKVSWFGCLYPVCGVVGVFRISRMSPWCTLATYPLFQAIVTASQLVSVMMPLSEALPRQ
jgi:hypothetical protein